MKMEDKINRRRRVRGGINGGPGERSPQAAIF